MSLYDPEIIYNHVTTIYCDNDTKFGDLKIGNKVFILDNNSCEVKVGIVTKEWKKRNGKVTMWVNKKCLTFGTDGSFNLINSCNDSIAHFQEFMLGTNKKSLIDARKKTLEEELGKYLTYVAGYKKLIENLELASK